MPTRLAVIELRQYRLQPGVREQFVTLFDRALARPQEAAGIRLLGRFRDLDRPDAFVWLRGFPDMAARAVALHEFYFGPVWAQHRQEANAMMTDSDDVLLLEPVELAPDGLAAPTAPEVLYVDVCSLPPGQGERYLDGYQRTVAPLLAAAGARPVAALQTLHAVNTFPQLPVREDEHVVVTVTSYPGVARAAAVVRRPEVVTAVTALAAWAGATPQLVRLEATQAGARHDVVA